MLRFTIFFSIASIALPLNAGETKKRSPRKEARTAANEFHFKKRADPGALQSQLRAAGFSIDYIDCSVDNCTIHMPTSEKKDPGPIVEKYVYVDPLAERKQRLLAMQGLYDKWQANSITADEKDALLKMLVQQVLGR